MNNQIPLFDVNLAIMNEHPGVSYLLIDGWRFDWWDSETDPPNVEELYEHWPRIWSEIEAKNQSLLEVEQEAN